MLVVLADRLAASGAIVLLPVLVLIVARAALLRSFPPNDAFVGDWYDHTVYCAFYLLGYLMAGQDASWTVLDRCRWPALIVAVGIAALTWAIAAFPSPPWFRVPRPYGTVAIPLYQWSVIVAVIAFGRRRLPSTDGPWRRYLTAAVFPFYIVHQTAIVVAAYVLRDMGWPAASEAAVIVLVTVATCLATFEVVRRTWWLRPLFGLQAATNLSPPITRTRP